MNKRQALGRGLTALIPEAEVLSLETIWSTPMMRAGRVKAPS